MKNTSTSSLDEKDIQLIDNLLCQKDQNDIEIERKERKFEYHENHDKKF